MRIAFFDLDEEQNAYFKQNLKGEIQLFNHPLTSDNLPEVKDFDIISIFIKSKLDENILSLFPNLKLIVIRAAGVDNIDLDYALAHNITVCNVPSYGPATVAEFTFGLIIALLRNIPQAKEQVKMHYTFDYQGLKGTQIEGKTIGIIGTGKIGSHVAKIASGFGLRVIAFDVYQNLETAKEIGFEYYSLDGMLKEADIVTIHIPFNPSTVHLLNKENISLMKKEAVVINTARGAIIETEALYDALKNCSIKGAALDVLEDEDNLNKSQLLKDLVNLNNVLVTPHIAFYTDESEKSIMETTLKNIESFEKGEIINVVKGG